MTDKPTRRDLMKPVQLLGLAFVAALFAGFVTLMSMGFFQTRPAEEIQRALVVAAVAAGATFIVTLVSVALLLLMVDPSKVTATIDRPLLLPTDDQDAAATGAATTNAGSEPASTDPTDAERPARRAADGPDGDTAAPKA